jgi:hypothetical protein
MSDDGLPHLSEEFIEFVKGVNTKFEAELDRMNQDDDGGFKAFADYYLLNEYKTVIERLDEKERVTDEEWSAMLKPPPPKKKISKKREKRRLKQKDR